MAKHTGRADGAPSRTSLLLATLFATFALGLVLSVVPTRALAADGVTVWRAYNTWTGEHLFTTDQVEYDNVGRAGWRLEGEAWQAPTSGDPVYRLSNPWSGDHHYTTDKGEYDRLGNAGWNREDVAFHSAPSTGRPVYRIFNPYVKVGTHHYTTSLEEYAQLGQRENGWRQERTGWYALGTSDPLPNEWVRVTGTLRKTTIGAYARERLANGTSDLQGNDYILNDDSPYNYIAFDSPIAIWTYVSGERYQSWDHDALTLYLDLADYSDNERVSLAVNQRENNHPRGIWSTFGTDASEVAIL